MRHLSSIAATAAVAAALYTGTANAQQINARLGHCVAPTDSVAMSSEFTKQALERLSNGRLTVTIFGGCQLGSLSAMLEQTLLGTLDLWPVPPSFAVGTNRNFAVPDAPGVFDDLMHASRALQNPMFREKFIRVADDKGLRVISLWVHSGSSYASLSPIRKLDDFRGKKIRVLATKVETELVSRLGATGVPVDFAQLLPALQQRTVDAARSSLSVMGGMKFYTVTKYATVVNDGFIPLVTFVSAKFYDKLPKDLQKVLYDAGREVELKMPPIALKQNQD